jgi:hypothetical protein
VGLGTGGADQMEARESADLVESSGSVSGRSQVQI